MRILVTGASGFIGRRLANVLAEAGHQVRAALRERRGQNFPAGVEIAILPDLAGSIDWRPLLEGIEAIVHLAGIAHVGRDVAEATYRRVNHAATAQLVSAAEAAGIGRLVFVSSIRAQTGPTADHPLNEADAANPTDPYGRSKLAAEAAVRAGRVPYVILRPVLVYGPGVKGNLASLMRIAASPLPLPLGGLTNRRSMVGIENLIAAIRFALEDPRAVNETFIVSDPGALSVAEIVAALRMAAGRRPALFPVPPRLLGIVLDILGDREQWDRLGGSLVAEPTKLVAAGWHPVQDTRAGIAAMVQAASPRKSGTASRSAP